MKIKRKCFLCGENVVIEYDKKTKIIKNNIFFSQVPKKPFSGWVYSIEYDSYDILKLKNNFKLKPIFKNKFWKVIGYTKLQRKIVYYIISKILERDKIDYIECEKCINR